MGLNNMKCNNCQYKSTKVLDSRPIEEGASIRRRRECERSGLRFTTFERMEVIPLMIIKKDGARQELSREKLIRGLIKACEQRPVALSKLETISNNVETELWNNGLME